MIAVPSLLAVTRRWPSGEKSMLLTPEWWPVKWCRSLPVAVSQRRTAPSPPVEASHFPSGENVHAEIVADQFLEKHVADTIVSYGETPVSIAIGPCILILNWRN